MVEKGVKGRVKNMRGEGWVCVDGFKDGLKGEEGVCERGGAKSNVN